MIRMVSLNDTDARMATIRALLAKAEATTFAAEAEAFTAKASELMTRYALDEAMIWSDHRTGAGSPTEMRIEVLRPFVAQKAVLINSVSQVFGCRAIRLGSFGNQAGELVSIVGFEADLELVNTLVTSLFLQLTSAMTRPTAHLPARTSSQVAAWRRSFIMGFTATVSDRLRADHQRAADETASANGSPGGGTRSVELVLRDRLAVVEDDFRERYPSVRTSSVSTGTSDAGRRAGTSAGKRADIGTRRLSTRRAIGSSS